MLAVDAVRKPLVTVAADDSIARAAQLMDNHAVGALVVFDGDRPVGIVTDRDIAIRAVARGVPNDARVDAVMSPGVIALPAGAELRKALPIFADLGEIMRPITGQVVFGHPEAANLPIRQRSD